MRLKKLILIMAALTMLVVLAACGSSGGNQGSKQGSNGGQKTKKEVKTTATTPNVQVAPDQGGNTSKDKASKGPQNKTMKLTVPKMAQLKNDTVPTGRGSDESLFKNDAGVHLQGTGFPWDKEANVYIAGHRLGFQGTPSYLAFWDIDKLKNGDKIFLQDANGKKYTYVVFNIIVTDPTNLSVLEPVKGKNIVSLQTCTLPDYSQRVIVQGELKA